LFSFAFFDFPKLVSRSYLMRFNLTNFAAAGLLAATLGCESKPTTPTTPPPNGRIDVNTGPGGVDVEVDRDGDGKKAVDVDVAPGGGVNVDIDRGEIRENVKERREERQQERAVNP
jgi:hypothetical protein